MDNINPLDILRVNVLLYVESRYQVNRKRIKSSVLAVLEKQQVATPVEVSIGIVGDRKMRLLNKKYRQKEGTTNVLSFSLTEGEKTVLPPPKKTKSKKEELLRLGDIVISYPQVIREAARDEMFVDDKIDELVKHAMLHLLGLHHE